MAKYVNVEELEKFIKELRKPCGCDYQCNCDYFTGREIADKLIKMIQGSNMGIEIIKRGKIPEERRTEETCTNCTSILGMKMGDCKYVSDQREGSYYTAECPVCKTMLIINPSRFK